MADFFEKRNELDLVNRFFVNLYIIKILGRLFQNNVQK